MTSAERNIRLKLAYDGTGYVGWQIQPNGVTVQEVLQNALRKVTGEATKVVAAGRTDSGVHALGQVANFRTACSIPTEKFPAALQSVLPHDIVIRAADDVAREFHATYRAVRKCYRYLIHLSERSLPFLRNYAWRIDRELDLQKMRKAAAHIVGKHDFRCFETRFPNKATSVRTVEHLSLETKPVWDIWSGFDFEQQTPQTTGKDDFLCLEISADGFLYNMVRAITGTLVDVGRGRFEPEQVARMIERGDRSLAGPTAPPQGLYLVSVDYAKGEDESRI